jgi:tetratricopeptide (TPR) repeat protein
MLASMRVRLRASSRCRSRRLCACALAACIAASATTAGFSPEARADETSPANVAAARRHFERARAYYAQGAYREAIAELEAAHSLDPNAKDLVFNLGVVHEKLTDIDDALKWFRLYTTMNLTAQERERADAYVKRLEGAKKEVEQKAAQAAAASASTAQPPPSPPPPAEHPGMGRVDALTISTAGIAVAGLAFGIIMAVKAEHDKPPTPFITGRNGTYADLVDRQNNAHREAVMADIGFGVAGAAAAATAVLFFARPRATASDRTGGGTTSVSPVPLAGGGGVFVQGSF